MKNCYQNNISDSNSEVQLDKYIRHVLSWFILTCSWIRACSITFSNAKIQIFRSYSSSQKKACLTPKSDKKFHMQQAQGNNWVLFWQIMHWFSSQRTTTRSSLPITLIYPITFQCLCTSPYDSYIVVFHLLSNAFTLKQKQCTWFMPKWKRNKRY